MMKKQSLLPWALGALLVLPIVGCKSSDDAPTNTKDSTYMGGGNTEADKIGAQRAKARLPKGGGQ